MAQTTPTTVEPFELDRLIQLLRTDGYEVIGPTLRDGVVVLDEIAALDELPRGMGDQQRPGHYRTQAREDGRYFGYVVGPHSWKGETYQSQQVVWRLEQTDGELRFRAVEPLHKRRAYFGARGCDLAAIDVQDRVFRSSQHPDPFYTAAREDNFLVAVHCSVAAATCFCTSMGTGPRAQGGFDLALTEVVDGDAHYFVAEAGTERGRHYLAQLRGREASEQALAAAQRESDNAGRQIAKNLGMDTDGIKDFLYRNLEHPNWDAVAERCLSCANCTNVCPTCFCGNMEDAPSLDAGEVEHVRYWDSCFNAGHSELFGAGSVHGSTRSRYRQWLTHKLGTWLDQFGTSGCVGCGRCVTWCPVGIDIREEMATMRQSDG